MTDPKSKILARRARFLAAAAASAGLVATGPIACSDSDDTSSVDAGADTAPTACLSVAPDTGPFDTGPSVCLSPVEDTGAADTATDSTTDTSDDAGPMPCLAPPPADGG